MYLFMYLIIISEIAICGTFSHILTKEEKIAKIYICVKLHWPCNDGLCHSNIRIDKIVTNNLPILTF